MKTKFYQVNYKDYIKFIAQRGQRKCIILYVHQNTFATYRIETYTFPYNKIAGEILTEIPEYYFMEKLSEALILIADTLDKDLDNTFMQTVI